MNIIEKLNLNPVVKEYRNPDTGMFCKNKTYDLRLVEAAPEMLEALIIRTYDSYKSIHSCGMTGGFRNGYIEQTRRHISIIEKATGKTWKEIKDLINEKT